MVGLFLFFLINLPNYPSQENVNYYLYKVKRGDSWYKLFKNDWIYFARFNRLGKLKPGLIIKIPYDLEDIKNYTPMPKVFDEWKNIKKGILVNLEEQFLGGYEFGELKFSYPISSADPDCVDDFGRKEYCETPEGDFEILAFDKNHKSSIYFDAETKEGVEMPYAILFFLKKTSRGVQAFWLHGGELPGYPASHGCVRLMLNDIKNLYFWAGGKNKDGVIWVKTGIPVKIYNSPFIYVEQGGVTIYQIPIESSKAYFDDRELSIFLKDNNKYVLITANVNENPGRHLLIVKSDSKIILTKTIIVKPVKYPKNISKFWNRRSFTKEELERIEKEKEELRKAYDNPETFSYWLNGFVYPIEIKDNIGKVLHKFGEIRINPINKRSRYHLGIDIKAPEGYPVSVIGDGVVKHAGFNYLLEGNITVVDHGNEIYSLYLHQSKIFVKVGEKVKKGQIIGLVGKTGNANGPHLHLMIRIKDVYIDPLKLLAQSDKIK